MNISFSKCLFSIVYTKCLQMYPLGLHDTARLILIFYCLNIQGHNRYNIYIQFSILTRCSSDKGWRGSRRRAAIFPRVGLLRYVRPQGRDALPSGSARTRLAGAAHVWREKSNFKFSIYLYLCRNFIVFVLNLVYLYNK